MSERAGRPAGGAPGKPGAAGKPGRPGRDPFGPPLDPAELRGVFRRLWARPFEEQAAFVARVNWNVLDVASEAYLMGWLADCLRGDVEAQRLALSTLDKLPHAKRGRHASAFRLVQAEVDEDLAARLAAVFGPVLGGPRKGAARPSKAAEPPRAASEDDLAKLKSFFGGSGGAR